MPPKRIDGAGEIRITTTVEDGRVLVRIVDTGRGIPAEKLDGLFDFSLSKDSERVKMGAGLSTAWNIVVQHQGAIQVESEVGQGSTFVIALPLNGGPTPEG